MSTQFKLRLRLRDDVAEVFAFRGLNDNDAAVARSTAIAKIVEMVYDGVDPRACIDTMCLETRILNQIDSGAAPDREDVAELAKLLRPVTKEDKE